MLGIVKSRKPPGIFLEQVSKDGSWKELDNRDTALRKTAQALEEKASELKKKVLEEAERKDLFQIAKIKKQKLIQPFFILGRSGIKAAFINPTGNPGQLNNSFVFSSDQSSAAAATECCGISSFYPIILRTSSGTTPN